MSEFKKWVVSEPYIDIQGSLLEGPCYDEARNEFRFVDIWDNKIHIVDLNKGPQSLRSIDTATAVSVTANIADDGNVNVNSGAYKDQILVGAKYGYALVHRQTGEISYLCKVWEGQGGAEKAETQPRKILGGSNERPKVKKPTQEGVLFRLDPDLKLHRMLDQLTIPNGIGWNDNDDTMYVTDSPTGRIYAFDFDASTGSIGNRRVHFQLDDGKEPDGFAIDTDGCIWSAIYGGNKVIRISPSPSPQDGKATIIGEISLPTRKVTCCTFVGTELFITMAKDEVNDELAGSERYGGRVFKIDVGIGGQPKYKFRFG